jgi:hypothetical protein
VADRIALEQFGFGVDMRPSIGRNNADGVHELGKLHKVARRLDDLHSELVGLAVRNTGLETVQFRFVSHVVLENILLFGPGFGLVGDLTVRRVDDAVATPTTTKPCRSRCSTWGTPAGSSATARRACTWGTACSWCSAGRTCPATTATASGRRLNIRNRRRVPEALHIRMTIRQFGHWARGHGWRTAASSRTTPCSAATGTLRSRRGGSAILCG